MVDNQFQHALFPVTLNAQWCPERSANLHKQLKDWLLDPSSLTARLTSLCQHFKVQLLGQEILPCRPEEANEDIQAGEQVLVREVLLLCDGIPQVFARSLLPLSSLTGEEKKLATLGNQSLGQVLFNNPKLTRKRIEVASFDKTSSVGQLSLAFKLTGDFPLWGRRSVFVVEEKPLMVAEVFLPQSFAYQHLAKTT